MFRIHSRIALTLAAIVFAGILAACSSSGDGTTTTPSATSSQSLSTTPQMSSAATQTTTTPSAASSQGSSTTPDQESASATQAAAGIPVGTDDGLCKATATVSIPAPASPNYTETVTGVLTCTDGIVPTQVLMHAVWHEEAGDEICEAVVVGTARASCSRQIGALTSGYKVVIDVTFELDSGAVYATTTSFTPQ